MLYNTGRCKHWTKTSPLCCSLQKTRRAKDSRDDNGQKNTSGQKSCGGFYKQTNQTRPKRLDSCTGTQVSSMRALVILPLLLCAVVCVDQVRAEVKAVKLCGREFLRAVVYTCGGSRWRRLLTESDMDGETTTL
ncbi:relaxin-3-like protein [Lates japonicus]|uniref:Relaxin-3-like protein n=1 Tax=Lates japonicus TaxID=270547 RepID=A0AAD3M8A5_LATJO|nr:relaxin-3-like protein [Lates japonicus]